MGSKSKRDQILGLKMLDYAISDNTVTCLRQNSIQLLLLKKVEDTRVGATYEKPLISLVLVTLLDL
jgi:hypothetical protein